MVPEVLRSGGLRVAKILAQVSHRAAETGVPGTRRGGNVMPVPRKPKLPLCIRKSRGILRASVPGELYAKVVRTAAAPALARVAGPTQLGAVKNGGAHFPAMAP